MEEYTARAGDDMADPQEVQAADIQREFGAESRSPGRRRKIGRTRRSKTRHLGADA